jgi:hypothetical protein
MMKALLYVINVLKGEFFDNTAVEITADRPTTRE